MTHIIGKRNSIIDVRIPVTFNTRDAHLWLQAESEATGELLWEGRGRSLVAGFIDGIHRHMRGSALYYKTNSATYADNPVFPQPVGGFRRGIVRFDTETSGNPYFWTVNSATGNAYHPIVAIEDNGSGAIRITTAKQTTAQLESSYGSNFPLLAVEGVVGVPANGIWAWEFVSESTTSGGRLVIDLVGSTFSGAFDDSGSTPRVRWISSNAEFYTGSSPNSVLQSGGINSSNTERFPCGFLIGRSNEPVSIDDIWLYDMISEGNLPGQLVHGVPTRTPPAHAGEIVEFTETRAFVNNNPSVQVDIREVGLMAGWIESSGNNPNHSLYQLARDLVEVDLVPAASVAITYRVRTTTPTTGGFTRQFLDIFYRDFANTSREAKTILNTNANTGSNISNLALNFNVSEVAALPMAVTHYNGICVGTSTKTCEPADYKLRNADDSDSIITHGVGAGQLYYGGSSVISDIKIEGNKAFFTVTRLFENRSGNAITVKEAGLHCTNTAANTSATGRTPHLLARHLVNPEGEPAGVEVPNGDALRVTYEIGVEIESE